MRKDMESIDLSVWLAGFERPFPDLYLVGGVVRDLLLGRQSKDVDMVCKDASTFVHLLAKGKDMAIVPMEKKPGEPCFRLVDKKDSTRFLDIAELRGESILEDLQRRDFTINAIAMPVLKNGQFGAMIDPTNGQGDIAGKIIRKVSNKGIESDPLRILRAFRFAAQMDFTIDRSTQEAMKTRVALLGQVSSERIMSELLLILGKSTSAGFIRQMDEFGIFDVIFPEVIPARGCTQNAYHHKDVWEHSQLVMENCEYILNHLTEFFGDLSQAVAHNLGENTRVPLLKLSSLLHDVGKPATRAVNQTTGRITFYGHDEVGSVTIASMAERLKMSNRDRNFMRLLVSQHLHVLSLSAPSVKPQTLLRWFRQLKDDAIPVIILGMADIKGTLGTEANEDTTAAHITWSKQVVKHYYDVVQKQLERKDFILGKDLIVMGMKPGPEMGRILAHIREAQDIGEIVDRDAAISLASELIAENTLSHTT